MSTPPGLRLDRLARLARRSVRECGVDLGGARVLTEAATGAYVVTPILAALGGAGHVDACTRPTRYGSVEEVRAQTLELAALAGVADRITVHDVLDPDLVATADVITNSGHLRPIDEHMIARMRPTAVVPLMFEAWEADLGRDDVDLAALRRRGVRFAGTNEGHPAIDVFAYHAPLIARALAEAAVNVRGSHLLVLCDNPFRPSLVDGLAAMGATVESAPVPSADLLHPDLDAVVVALTPRAEPVMTDADLQALAGAAPHALVVQLWGDLPRATAGRLGIGVLPETAPAQGHMGYLPSGVGPEPIVRLQAGGLRVAAALLRPPTAWTAEDLAFLDLLPDPDDVGADVQDRAGSR